MGYHKHHHRSTGYAPHAIQLEQNYPNPFNPATTIPFRISEPADVFISSYDIKGRVVATLVDGWRPAGLQAATWTAAGIPSGVYFCRLHAGGDVRNLRMMLLK